MMRKNGIMMILLKVIAAFLLLTNNITIQMAFASGGPWFRQSDTNQDKDDDDSDCKKKEQSDNNECCDQKQKGESGEPVFLYNGKFYYKKEDLSIPSRIPINIIRYYDSMSSYNAAFGYGWTISYNYRIYRYSDGKLLLQKGNNDQIWYTPVTLTQYLPPVGYNDRIDLNPDGSYTLSVKNNRFYEFSSNGYLTKIQDTNNNELRFTYSVNADDVIIKLPITGVSPFSNRTDPIVVAMDYRLLKVEEYVSNTPTNKYAQFFYDTTGRVNRIADNAGREVFYIYDNNNNGDLVSVIDAQGNPYNYTYENHRMESFVGLGCNDCSVHTNTYDSQGRVVGQEHGNLTMEIDYINYKSRTKVTTSIYNDTSGSLLHTRYEYYDFNNRGYVTRYTRQMGNRLDTDINSNETDDIVTSFTYTSQNQTESMTDPMGNITRYTYDSNGNLLTETKTLTNGEIITKTYTYHLTFNRVLSEELASNRDTNTYRTEYIYDANGNMIEERKFTSNAEYLTTSYTYYADGSIDTITYPEGNQIKYEYNNAGQITREYDPNNTSHQTTYTYDNQGNRTSVTDANNHTTTYGYDNLSRLTSITNPLGQQTIYTYTDANITQMEQGKTDTQAGHITRITYDDLNRKESIIKETSSGNITIAQYTYDSEGNVLSVTDANGNTTNNTYDVIGRLSSVADPLGNTTLYTYDKNDNMTSTTDAEGNTTTYQYNGLGRLMSVTQPEVDSQVPVTTYTYNALGNVLTITDAEGHTTTNIYDKLGRLTAIRSPLDAVTSYIYDGNDNLISKTDANEATITYEYDNYNQLLSVIASGSEAISFTYDNIGNLLSYNNGVYTYDALNRIISATAVYPFGNKTISYTYDRFGNKTTATYPDTGTVTYNYDEMDRLLSVIASGSEAISYAYDNASRLTTKTLGNGTAINYTYDNANRLLSVIASDSEAHTGVASLTISYTYDYVGNRLSKTDTQGEHAYTYDNLYRLENATLPDETYTYDKVGNRLTNQDYADWTYNTGNQLTNYNGTDFTYDNNGNTLTKTTADGTATYTWDVENRLVSVIASASEAIYYYDPFGKRLSKTVNGTTTWYLYDNEDIVAEYDNAGTLLRSYVHGQGIDEPVRMTDASTSSNYFYLSDGLGSIIQIQDSSKDTVESYTYDSFGTPTIKDSTGTEIPQSAIHNPYMFTGREYDSETGLYYYRARYYDPGVGRFLNKDPIGFLGGINFYSYVFSNPINLTDAFGLIGPLPPWAEPSGPGDLLDPRQSQVPHWFLISQNPRTKPFDRPKDFFRHQSASCNSVSDYNSAKVKCEYEFLGTSTEKIDPRVITMNVGTPFKSNYWKIRITEKDIIVTYNNFNRTCYRCARKCQNGSYVYLWDKISSENDSYKAQETFFETVEHYGYDYST